MSKTKTETAYPKDENMQYCGDFSKIKEGYNDEILKLRDQDKNTLKICSNNQKALADFINQLKNQDKKDNTK